MNENTQKLLDYLYASPTAFHATKNACEELLAAGFTELFECQNWELKAGGKYFVRKNSSAFIAFIAGKSDIGGVLALAAHTDSPSFVIKPNAQMTAGNIVKLNTSPYGGGIYHTWFDRPLAIAGRVFVKGDCYLSPKEVLVNLNRPLLIIPSLAIHLNREINNGVKLNAQVDTLPVAAIINAELENNNYLMSILTKELDCEIADILDFELLLYEYDKGCVMGADEEFISAGRLDDLWMVHSAVQALKNAQVGEDSKLIFCPDNEEIGSLTSHGGESRFLESVLRRIAPNKCEQSFAKMLAKSYIISADLAHASHPNYPEKSDPTTKTTLGGGAVLKYSPQQRYATTAHTASIFRGLCEEAGVPCQAYIVRSDVAGGSTVGAMISANLGLRVVDMGMPLLAMHSIRELAAVADNEYVLKLFNKFFE